MNFIGALSADVFAKICELAQNSSMFILVSRKYSQQSMREMIEFSACKALAATVGGRLPAATGYLQFLLRSILQQTNAQDNFWRSYALNLFRKTTASVLHGLVTDISTCVRANLKLPRALTTTDIVPGFMYTGTNTRVRITVGLFPLECKLTVCGDKIIGLMCMRTMRGWHRIERAVEYTPQGHFRVHGFKYTQMHQLLIREDMVFHFVAGTKYLFVVVGSVTTLIIKRLDLETWQWDFMRSVNLASVVERHMQAHPESERNLVLPDFRYNFMISHVAQCEAREDGAKFTVLVTFSKKVFESAMYDNRMLAFEVDWASHSVTVEPRIGALYRWCSHTNAQSSVVIGKRLYLMSVANQSITDNPVSYEMHVCDLAGHSVEFAVFQVNFGDFDGADWKTMAKTRVFKLIRLNDWTFLAVFGQCDCVVPIVLPSVDQLTCLMPIKVKHLLAAWNCRADPVCKRTMLREAKASHNSVEAYPGGFIQLQINNEYDVNLQFYRFADSLPARAVMERISAAAGAFLARVSHVPDALFLLAPTGAEVVQRKTKKASWQALRFDFALANSVSVPLQ